MDSTLIRCSSTIRQADVEIDIRPDDRIVKAGMSNERELMSSALHAAHIALTCRSNRLSVDDGSEWHDDTSTADIDNNFMVEPNNSTAFLDPHQPPLASGDLECKYGRLQYGMFAVSVANSFA
jgi:hypothetical protein